MADMILEYTIMPKSGEVDYEVLEKDVKSVAASFDESVKIKKVEKVPLSFGLFSCKINLQIDENCGSEGLENAFKEQENIGNVKLDLMDRL